MTNIVRCHVARRGLTQLRDRRRAGDETKSYLIIIAVLKSLHRSRRFVDRHRENSGNLERCPRQFECHSRTFYRNVKIIRGTRVSRRTHKQMLPSMPRPTLCLRFVSGTPRVLRNRKSSSLSCSRSVGIPSRETCFSIDFFTVHRSESVNIRC